MKATQPVLSSGTVMLYKVVLAFETVDEILKCDNSSESSFSQYFPVVLFIMLLKVVQTSGVCG